MTYFLYILVVRATTDSLTVVLFQVLAHHLQHVARRSRDAVVTLLDTR